MSEVVYTTRKPERIVTSAVLANGVVYTSDKSPCRHGDVIEVMQAAGLDTIRLAVPENQGFLTSIGRYVDRREAFKIAAAADQLGGGSISVATRELYSEDVW